MLLQFPKFVPATAGAVALLALTAGCTDQDYDLGNLDTEMQIAVNELTVPLNLAPVKFESMVKLDDAECIKVDADGNYVMIQDGTFSEEIIIDNITARPTAEISLHQQQMPLVAGQAADIVPARFPFSYENQSDMQKYITRLDGGKVDFNMEISLKLNDSHGAVRDYSVNNLAISVPKGFSGVYACPDGTASTFDPQNRTAVFSGTARPDASGTCLFVLNAKGIDITAMDSENVDIDYSTGHIYFKDEIAVAGGSIAVDGGASQAVRQGQLDISLDLGALTVNTLTGNVRYDLTDLERQHVDLSDIPSELADPETRIRLVNPQIYVRLNNPLHAYGFYGNSGLTISQVRRPGQECYSATMDGRIRLLPTAGAQSFAICPDPDALTVMPKEYAGATKMTMPGLENIVYGDGLPGSLEMYFLSPVLEEHHVTDFELDHNYGTVEGSYRFLAPLAFQEGSRVIYTGTESDWDLGEDDELEISALNIDAALASSLPTAITLSAKPLDRNGDIIEGTEVRVEPEVIAAGYNGDVKIYLTGTIRNLGGMQYTVRLEGSSDHTPLRPDQELSLQSIRATVTGKYIIKDNDSDK